MNLFEYSDILNSPIEAFYCTDRFMKLPVHSHWHYFVEMIFVEEGEVTITCDDKAHIMKEGDMLIIPPRTVHSIFQDKPAPFKYACVKYNARMIRFPDSYIPDLSSLLAYLSQLEEPPLYYNESLFDPGLLRLFFDRVISEAHSREYGYNTYIYSNITSLLLQVIRHLYKSGISLEPDIVQSNDSSSLHKALMYIDEHSNENISISDLADLSNMSYSYFAKQFHAKYGQSCKQYIESIRLYKAENLLLFTDYDLNYIAGETGFSDCSHLIKCFKKKYNTTPKQFRKSHGL